MITNLIQLSAQIQSQPVPAYQRFLFSKIDFSQRLIGIMGARGAGKTTLLLQHLKSLGATTQALYIISDHPLVEQYGLFDIANAFQQIGGEVLVIDEVYKSKNFETELKLIYDSFFNLKVIFTGSSAAAINHAKADLSRRAIIYHLPVLSFREYLELETNQKFDVLSLEDIIGKHTQKTIEIVSRIKPLAYFPAYLEHGAYPFYKETSEANLFSVFCGESKVGTRRETFFASMLSYLKGGDFMVDERYVFEVGGRSKSKRQIKDLENAWIVADDIEIGAGQKIPLWLFGFLY